MTEGWKLDKEKPICPQIIDQFVIWIASGVYGGGQKLPSVRELAIAAGVNPNTVQKSFEKLEEKKLIYSERGKGWFVGTDTERAENEMEALIEKTVAGFFDEMKKFGYSEEKTKEVIGGWKHE